MRIMGKFAALVASVALVSASAVAVSAPAQAAKAKGAITITLDSDLAYIVTGQHWVGVKPARVGIEPAGTPFPGPTVRFPVSFEDGTFKVRGKGALALGPGSILARMPLVGATPEQLAKSQARVDFLVGNGSMPMTPFVVKNFEKVGTDTDGFTLWMGDLHATRDKKTLRDFNSFSGLSGGKALKPGQSLGILRLEIKSLI